METTKLNSLIESIIDNGSKIGPGGASFYLASILFIVVITQIITGRKRFLSGGSGNNVKHGIEVLPGPKSLPLIGNALDLYPMTETINATAKWCKMYGPCFKVFGPLNKPIVGLNSDKHVEALLKSGDYGHLVKMPMVYDLMKPLIGNGVLVSTGNFWHKERKILLKSMSFKSLRSYIPMLNTHCQRFVDALEKLFSDGQVHTISDLISSTFLDIICEVITGFDMHNSSEGVEYHHNFQIWKKCIGYRIVCPWFIPSLIWRLHPLSRENDAAIKHLLHFAKRRIALHKAKRISRRQNGSDENLSNSSSSPPFQTVLDELMDSGVSDHQIMDEVNTMIFGGHETGAGAIHFLCMCLALNPDIQEKCRREVDAVFDDGRIGFDSLSKLKYVERTILETLRLYPPIFGFARQLQAPLKFELNGECVEVPLGTDVALCPFVLHRNEEYFPDPERFNPDRHRPEEIAKRPPYSYIPFSMGPRNCLGLKFAMIELKMIAAFLVRNFDIQTTDRLEDVKLLPSTTLTPERDYNFFFKRRTMS